MRYLEGGRKNKIARSQNTVHRPAGFWSKAVHDLLNHVRAQGFLGVPQPLGFDDDGNEILTFLVGEVSNYPLSATASSIEALTSAAKLLRSYHDATVSFLENKEEPYSWMLPPRDPAQVICHGDYAPYNVVLHGETAVAIIDFDTAHPGSRAWDIAYAIYRWAPLSSPQNPDGFGSYEDKIHRAHMFCDSYELSWEQRGQLIPVTIERIQALVDFMFVEAAAGNEAFQENIADGHHLAYLADIAYLQEHQEQISDALLA
jgi:aminoglycoside phosphotransferase (APT) family kinase protein